MFSLFKSSNPGVVVFYWIYLILFRLCFFFSSAHSDFVFHPNEPLSHFLFGLLPANSARLEITSLSLSALLTFIQAILINGIVNENKMTFKKNYLAGFVFIIYASFFRQTLLLSPAALAFTFIILSVAAIFRLSKKEKAHSDVFDVGFLAAVACLFYFPSVIFIFFAYIAMGSVRSFSYREWMAVLLGFFSPLFLAFTYYYFTDTGLYNFLPVALFNGAVVTSIDWALMAAFAFCSFTAFVMLQGVLYSSLIQVRKFTTLLISLFILFALAIILQRDFSLSHLILLTLPSAIISAMVFLQMKRKVIVEVIHLILILLVLTGQYLPLFNIL